MHHALHVEEILLNIFSYCYDRGHRAPSALQRRGHCYANAHLAALARTCKTFKDPALDMIWADLEDLTPLVCCLPETSWVKSGCFYSLTTHLEQSEWDTILGYAQRVQVLPRLCGSSGLAGDCIEVLSNPPNSVQSIFPNLRVVGLYAPNAMIAPLVRHFAHRKLTTICFEDVENLGVTVTTFGEECPLVTDFRVSQSGHADTISSLICCWENLHSVKAYSVSLNANALSHLSHLGHLRNVSFRVHDAVVDRIYATQPSTSLLTFSALDDVYLTSHSLTSAWRLLRKIRLPAIHTISVSLKACLPAASDLMSSFVALQDACTHGSLNHIRVFHSSDESNDLHSEAVPPYYITFDRLRPLTVFINLKSILLNISRGVDLNEHQLLRLASSWPHLEKFEVGENYDWTPSSAITPGGFLQLLERCRSLRVLSFMLDTRGYTDIPQGHPWRGLTMPQGAFIHVLNSPIEEESIEALGVFFHVAPYPHFGLTTHWNNRYFRGSERPQGLCDLYYSRWVEARSLAYDLWKERRELRRSLETRQSPRHSQ